MSDLISRQAAIEALYHVDEYNGRSVESIRKLPPEQPERIRGRWIYTGVKFPNWEGQVVSEAICSECNGISYFRRAFDKYIGANICPNCGADMTGEHDD
jgi:hypothetical protein